MESHEKEVLYAKYCGKCKYRRLQENQEPCEACLSNPSRFDSHKPLKFEKGVATDAKRAES